MAKRTPWLRALVEGLVIVASILIAFAVDASWDSWQEARQGEALREALLAEFEATRSSLGTSHGVAEFREERARAFLTASGALSTPVDSIRAFYSSATRPILFEASLPAYEGASRSGALGALQNAGLFEALTRFELNRRQFDRLTDRAESMFFEGRLFALAAELGSVYALQPLQTREERLPARFALSDAEYREYVGRPHVYATLEAFWILQGNKKNALAGMDEALAQAVAALQRDRN